MISWGTSDQQVPDDISAIRNSTRVSDIDFFELFVSFGSGENPLPADDPSKELMGKTEVSLTLTNKFDVPGEANAEMDAKTLLLKWACPVDSKSTSYCLTNVVFPHVAVVVSLPAPRGSLWMWSGSSPGTLWPRSWTPQPARSRSGVRSWRETVLIVIWVSNYCKQATIWPEDSWPWHTARLHRVENYWAALWHKTGSDFLSCRRWIINRTGQSICLVTSSFQQVCRERKPLLTLSLITVMLQ